MFDPNISIYDKTRPPVGKLYRDLQIHTKPDPIINGDMTNEIMKGLVEDLQETIDIGTKQFHGEEFYIVVHEKKDLIMKSAILRRMIKMTRRPYPEDDTLVFRVIPRVSGLFFCWCLPHWSEMKNMLMNKDKFRKDLIAGIKAWLNEDMRFFGFRKNSDGKWESNPDHKDRPLKQKKA